MRVEHELSEGVKDKSQYHIFFSERFHRFQRFHKQFHLFPNLHSGESRRPGNSLQKPSCWNFIKTRHILIPYEVNRNMVK